MVELVEWLSDQLVEGIKTARLTGNLFVTSGASMLDVSVEVAERVARSRVEAAEAQLALFEETVRPYLGTAGPTGRIAEQQLRLLAVMHADRPGFLEEWRP